MRNVVCKLIVTSGLVFGLTLSSANAALMGVSEGTWSNAQGTAANVTYSGPTDNKVSWGQSAGSGQSSWTFYGLDDIDVLTNGDWFKIGKFKHKNNPIYKYDFLGADLGIDLTIDGSSTMLSYTVGNWET